MYVLKKNSENKLYLNLLYCIFQGNIYVFQRNRCNPTKWWRNPKKRCTLKKWNPNKIDVIQENRCNPGNDMYNLEEKRFTSKKDAFLQENRLNLRK